MRFVRPKSPCEPTADSFVERRALHQPTLAERYWSISYRVGGVINTSAPACAHSPRSLGLRRIENICFMSRFFACVCVLSHASFSPLCTQNFAPHTAGGQRHERAAFPPNARKARNTFIMRHSDAASGSQRHATSHTTPLPQHHHRFYKHTFAERWDTHKHRTCANI